MAQEHDSVSRYGYEAFREEPHHRLLLPVVGEFVPSGQPLDILDVGCGTGFVAAALTRLGHHVVAVDVAEDGIAIGRAACPDVHFEIASAYDDWSALAPPGGWDAIVALEVIEHLYAPQRFLQNAHNSLKPDGFVVVTTPYHGYVKNLAISLLNGWDRHFTVSHEGGHIKFFSTTTLSRMLVECGFSKPTFRYAGRMPGLWKGMICHAMKTV